MGFFDDTAFASDALGEVLIRAGAWAPAQPDPGAKKETARSSLPFSRAAPNKVCAWSVCRAWRDCLRGPPPDRLARLLLKVHGPDQALERAVCCTSAAVDRCDLIRAVLRLPGVRADCQDGTALVQASARGCQAVVRLLLGWEEHAPRADCLDGRALLEAAEGGHEAVVRLLLGWEEHPPQADCQQGQVLVVAAGGGHEAVVRLLLGWEEHAPQADCQRGQALVVAARGAMRRLCVCYLNGRSMRRGQTARMARH